jgi:hypothetical protein
VALLALAGLLVAVAVTLAATSLVGQHVALSGDPRVPDEQLVPARIRTAPPPSVVAPSTPHEHHDSDDDADDDD